ncbi:MAG: phenylacetate--CoA ligase family protein [Lachnospiraceae bacterium]|nr:phenylacetate--CoA ligase family protein [Lachnospiraceae bacterium]
MEKLNRILKYATQNVPFYRDGKYGVDIDEFPIVSKKIIRNNYDIFRSKLFAEKEIYYEYTSGTSGEPFLCGKSETDLLRLNLSLYRKRFAICNTLKPNSKTLVIGSGGLLANYKQNMLILSNSFFEEKYLAEILGAIVGFQPEMIYATPSQFLKFTLFLKESDRLSYISDKVNIVYIELAGEILTEELRGFFEESWKRAITNQYGCREVWHIAFACKEGHLHICEDNVYVEIVDEEGNRLRDGEKGEVVLTSLNIQANPYIRYRLGDIASISTQRCCCGCEAPYLELESGRKNESLLFDNEKIESVEVHRVFKAFYKKGYRGVLKYALSKGDGCVKINLVVNDCFDTANEAFVLNEFQNKYKDIKFQICYSNDLEMKEAGKTRVLCSE